MKKSLRNTLCIMGIILVIMLVNEFAFLLEPLPTAYEPDVGNADIVDLIVSFIFVSF